MDQLTKERLEEFLTKNIYPKDLAKFLRSFKYEAVKMLLNMENDDAVRKGWFSDGHYFLTELCEILDPSMEDEEK